MKDYLTHLHAQSGFLNLRMSWFYGDVDFLEKAICQGVNRAGILDNSIFESLPENVRGISLSICQIFMVIHLFVI